MNVETEYAARLQALPPYERVARSAAMFQWTREMLGRQIVAERLTAGESVLSPQQLKWHIARRMYAAEPAVVKLIDQRLADVSR
jgi:hypothetical protein